MTEISGSASYQLCLWHFALFCDYLVGLKKEKYSSFHKKHSEIKVKLTLQLSLDLIINPVVLEAGGRVAACPEQWQRYNLSHSRVEVRGEPCAKPTADAMRGAADCA